MAKKFGKFLLFTAAVSSAVAAVYYFVHKKNGAQDSAEEEDYDDFSNDAEKDSDASRSYVPLNPETSEAETAAPEETDPEKETEAPAEEGFTPLADQVPQDSEKAEDSVEEFFDEEDGSDEEPPISDN